MILDLKVNWLIPKQISKQPPNACRWVATNFRKNCQIALKPTLIWRVYTDAMAAEAACETN